MSENLKQLLIAKNDWFAGELIKGVKASRFSGITPAQSRLLANMAGKPMSMAKLGRRLAISRQAVHKCVSQLEQKGILQVQTDPERGNSKLVVYTAKGREVNRAGADIIAALEKKIMASVGATNLEQLKLLLAQPWD